MHPFIEIVYAFFGSSFKFLVGFGFAFNFGFSFFKGVTVVTLGGFVGSVVCVFAMDKINLWLKRFIKQKSTTPKRVFTRTNKFIVLAKRRFGLVGIAALTPLLSYALGCYVAVRYFKDKQKILLYMFTSTLMWSIVFFAYKLFFPQL
jgi:hypothetical protein